MAGLLMGVIAGVVATFILDIWSTLAGRIDLVAKPSWALLRRWVCHFAKGRFLHTDIRETGAMPGEAQVGVLAHNRWIVYNGDTILRGRDESC